MITYNQAKDNNLNILSEEFRNDDWSNYITYDQSQNGQLAKLQTTQIHRDIRSFIPFKTKGYTMVELANLGVFNSWNNFYYVTELASVTEGESWTRGIGATGVAAATSSSISAITYYDNFTVSSLQATLTIPTNGSNRVVTLTSGTTDGIVPGQNLVKASGTGVFGSGIDGPKVLTVDSSTQFTVNNPHTTAGSITFTASSGTQITYQTSSVHPLAPGDSVTIAGVGGATSGSYNGVFTVRATTSDTFTVDTTAIRTPTLSSATVSYTGLKTYTTQSDHKLNAGDQVTTTNFTSSGNNGKFIVRSVPSSTTFVVKNTSSGSTSSGTVTSNATLRPILEKNNTPGLDIDLGANSTITLISSGDKIDLSSFNTSNYSLHFTMPDFPTSSLSGGTISVTLSSTSSFDSGTTYTTTVSSSTQSIALSAIPTEIRSNLIAVKFVIATNAACTFRCTSIRCLNNNYIETSIDFNNKTKRLIKPLLKSGNVGAYSFPVGATGSEPVPTAKTLWDITPPMIKSFTDVSVDGSGNVTLGSSTYDPKPVNVDASVIFNTGSMKVASKEEKTAISAQTGADYLQISNANGALSIQSGAFTVEAWVYSSNTNNLPGSGTYPIFYKSSGVGVRNYRLTINNNQIDFGYRNSSGVNQQTLTTTLESSDWSSNSGWHYIVGVFDDTITPGSPTLNIYFDGVLIKTETKTGSLIAPSTTGYSYIGFDSVSNYIPTSLSFTDIAVYDQTLTATKIKNKFALGKYNHGTYRNVTVADDPIGYWQFNEASLISGGDVASSSLLFNNKLIHIGTIDTPTITNASQYVDYKTDVGIGSYSTITNVLDAAKVSNRLLINSNNNNCYLSNGNPINPKWNIYCKPVTNASSIKITNISVSGTNVTYTTSAAHNLTVGEPVQVTGCVPTAYNLTGFVTAITTSSPYTFTIAGTHPDGSSALPNDVVVPLTSIADTATNIWRFTPSSTFNFSINDKITVTGSAATGATAGIYNQTFKINAVTSSTFDVNLGVTENPATSNYSAGRATTSGNGGTAFITPMTYGLVIPCKTYSANAVIEIASNFNQNLLSTAEYNQVGLIARETEVVPYTQSDLNGQTQTAIDSQSSISIKETHDNNINYASFYLMSLLWNEWGSNIQFQNELGNNGLLYNFPIGNLLPNTNYQLNIQLKDNKFRIHVIQLNNQYVPIVNQSLNDEFLNPNAIYDTNWIVDDRIIRRKGRFGWWTNFYEGDAYIRRIGVNSASHAEYVSNSMRSKTPVSGVQIFAESSPPIEKVFYVYDAATNNGLTKSSEGEYTVTNYTLESIHQGFVTNEIIVDHSKIEINFDLFLLNNESIEIYLESTDQDIKRKIPFSIPTLKTNQTNKIFIPLNDIEFGRYKLHIVQNHFVNNVLKLSNLSVKIPQIEWSARSRHVDDWQYYRLQPNNLDGGLMFERRGKDLQIRGTAKNQFGSIQKIKTVPKYAELGAFDWSKTNDITDVRLDKGSINFYIGEINPSTDNLIVNAPNQDFEKVVSYTTPSNVYRGTDIRGTVPTNWTTESGWPFAPYWQNVKIAHTAGGTSYSQTYQVPVKINWNNFSKTATDPNTIGSRGIRWDIPGNLTKDATLETSVNGKFYKNQKYQAQINVRLDSFSMSSIELRFGTQYDYGKIVLTAKDNNNATTGFKTVTVDWIPKENYIIDSQISTPIISNVTTTTSSGTLSSGTYYYVITSVDNAGVETIQSETASGTLASNGSIILEWAPIFGAVKYNVYRNTTDTWESGSLLLSTTQNTIYTDDGSVAQITGLPPSPKNLPSDVKFKIIRPVSNNYINYVVAAQGMTAESPKSGDELIINPSTYAFGTKTLLNSNVTDIPLLGGSNPTTIQIGNEYISYTGVKPFVRPLYKLTGITRGARNSTPEAHPAKSKISFASRYYFDNLIFKALAVGNADMWISQLIDDINILKIGLIATDDDPTLIGTLSNSLTDTYQLTPNNPYQFYGVYGSNGTGLATTGYTVNKTLITGVQASQGAFSVGQILSGPGISAGTTITKLTYSGGFYQITISKKIFETQSSSVPFISSDYSQAYYKWVFDDGTIKEGQLVTHTFKSDPAITASLTESCQLTAVTMYVYLDGKFVDSVTRRFYVHY